MKQQSNKIEKTLNKQQVQQTQNSQNKISFWAKICPCLLKIKKIQNDNQYTQHKSVGYIQQNQQTQSYFPGSQKQDFITIAQLQKNNKNNTRQTLQTFKKRRKQENIIIPQNRNTVETYYTSLKKLNSNLNQSNLKSYQSKLQSMNPKQIQQKLQQMNLSQEYDFQKKNKTQKQSQFSVNKISENKLIVLGNHKAKLLCKITSVYIDPYPSAIEKQKQSFKNKKKNKKTKLNKQIIDYEIDKYWEKRYFLFQKFDQGIKLDKQSWYSVTPQSVADYIASKIQFNGIILDAFCGAGGDSIKIAFASKKVISNDIDPVKIQCLINNAKIYGAQNIQFSCSNFFDFAEKVDAVYLAPPWGGPQYFQKPDFYPDDFSPPLNKIFRKSLMLSSNLFFLLPANTNVEQLSACLSNELKLSGQKHPACSLKIQKIYFNGRLKFLAGYFGDMIQTQIKINEQLDFIYNMLRQPEQGIFKHKKVIRKLRQQYGMVWLLNIIFECQKNNSNLQNNFDFNSQKCLMDCLYEYISQQNIISQQKLSKLKEQQQFQYQTQKQRYKLKKQKKIKKNMERHEQIKNLYKPNFQQDNQKHHPFIYQNQTNSIKDTDLQELVNSKQSKISSFGQQDAERTLSYVSQLTQDQLRQAMIINSFNRPQSESSIRQSLDYLKRFDTFQSSNQFRKSQKNRYSSPLYMSPKKQNYSPQKQNMQKKQCSYWQEGIQQIIQEKQKDFQQQ